VAVEELSTVAGPPWLIAARRGNRKHPPAIRKWREIDLVLPGLIRYVGEPSAIGRQLRGALIEGCDQERPGLAALGERPDVPIGACGADLVVKRGLDRRVTSCLEYLRMETP